MKLLKINGFNVLHEQRNGVLANIRIVTNAGSSNEPTSIDFGVAHYLEHMLFKGSEQKTYKQINMEMSTIGDANAYTHFGRTVYYMSTLTYHYIEALKLLSEIFFTPSLLQKEFDKEKNVILEECQFGKDNPTSSFYNNALQELWGDDGHPIIGNKESITKITLKQLKAFRKNHYTKENVCFVIVGDIAEEKLLQECSLVLSKYEKMLPSGLANLEYKEFKPNHQDVFWKHKSQQSIMGMFYRSQADSDLKKNNFVSLVFENGLGGGMHSLLFDVIREKLGLCYSIQMFNYSCKTTKSTIVCVALDKKNVDKARLEIEKIMQKVKYYGFSESLLDVAKKNTIFNIANEICSPNGYAEYFGDTFFTTENVDFETIKNSIKQLTNQDVVNYAQWVATTDYQFACQNK